MTLEEFYSEFRQVAKNFELIQLESYKDLNSTGQIRQKDKISTCPITGVCQLRTKLYYPGWLYSDAAGEINLPSDLADDIAYAADGYKLENNNRAEIRDTLINILNEVNHGEGSES